MESYRTELPNHNSSRVQWIYGSECGTCTRYYRGTVLSHWERYYRPTVLLGASTVPTTAESSGLMVVSAVLARGTTVARYYRTGSGTTAPPYYRRPVPCPLPQ